MAEEMMEEEVVEEESAPEGGEQPQGFDEEQIKEISDQLSTRAMDVIKKMQELGFILSKVGASQEQLQQLAGHFQAFMDTFEGIIGGASPEQAMSEEEGAPAPAPDQGNQPVDQMSGGKGVPVL